MGAYLIASLALIVKPGPDLMCTLATSLAEGRVRAFTLMCGLIFGCWLWIWLLVLGVAPLLAAHANVMRTIQLAGMAYIAYLAFGAFREAFAAFRAKGGAGELKAAAGAGWRLFGRGIAMSMSNPLTILFFLAFLPSFVHADWNIPPAVQILLLGTLFCLIVPFVYVPIILLADICRARLVGNAIFLGVLKGLSGLILILVVAFLAVDVLFAES